MNPRIRELAEQAGFTYIRDEGIGWAGNHNSSLPKFAALIVQECIAIVKPSSYRRAYPENYRGGMDCLDTLDDRVEKIKEHFGVEQ